MELFDQTRARVLAFVYLVIRVAASSLAPLTTTAVAIACHTSSLYLPDLAPVFDTTYNKYKQDLVTSIRFSLRGCFCLLFDVCFRAVSWASRQIRVEAWIMKLNGPYPLPNVAWRKNRNAFAALLARAVEEADFREPFDRRPPGCGWFAILYIYSGRFSALRSGWGDGCVMGGISFAWSMVSPRLLFEGYKPRDTQCTSLKNSQKNGTHRTTW